MLRPLENHMVIGSYYPEPRTEADEDQEYEIWRARQIDEETARGEKEGQSAADSR